MLIPGIVCYGDSGLCRELSSSSFFLELGISNPITFPDLASFNDKIPNFNIHV